mgnify:CR=1 FL=1|jgi:hypothetical protein|tara:strand:- start:1923 stop:2255 length:333 start_codon:yes stop_codon:yes gene_type:complete
MEQKITIKVNSTYKYLQLWNGIFNLTDMELRVLSTLVDLQLEEGTKNLCASDNKKQAARALGISDFNTLNNYVKKFKDKRAIRKVGKNYVLNQLLNVKTTGVKVNIKRES